MLLWLCFLATFANPVCQVSAFDSQITYPVHYLQPVTGVYFSGTLSRNSLTCFGNREYLAASLLDALGCLLSIQQSCYAIWGSRSVVFETSGGMEVYRIQKLPSESPKIAQHMNVSRWIQLSAAEESHELARDGRDIKAVREVAQIAAEPVFVCARCNDWRTNHTAFFSANFRPAFIRDKDMANCSRHVMFLLLIIFFGTIYPALLKLVIIGSGSYFGFRYGLQRFIIIFSSSVVMSTVIPMLRGKKDGRFFFNHIRGLVLAGQEKDAKEVIRHSLLVIDVLFFSSLIVSLGSIATYGVFYFDWVGRETRNELLKVIIAFAVFWLMYFFCTAFDHFATSWGWLGVVLASFRLLAGHVNSGSAVQVKVALLAMALFVKWTARKVSSMVPIRSVVRLILPQLSLLLQTMGYKRAVITKLRSGNLLGTSGRPAAESPLDSLLAPSKQLAYHNANADVLIAGDVDSVTSADRGKRRRKRKKKMEIDENLIELLSDSPFAGNALKFPELSGEVKRTNKFHIFRDRGVHSAGSSDARLLAIGGSLIRCVEAGLGLINEYELVDENDGSFLDPELSIHDNELSRVTINRCIKLSCGDRLEAMELVGKVCDGQGLWSFAAPSNPPRGSRAALISHVTGVSSFANELLIHLSFTVCHTRARDSFAQTVSSIAASTNRLLSLRFFSAEDRSLPRDVLVAISSLTKRIAERASKLHFDGCPLATRRGLQIEDDADPASCFDKVAVTAAIDLRKAAALLGCVSESVHQKLVVADAYFKSDCQQHVVHSLISGLVGLLPLDVGLAEDWMTACCFSIEENQSSANSVVIRLSIPRFILTELQERSTEGPLDELGFVIDAASSEEGFVSKTSGIMLAAYLGQLMSFYS